MNRCDTCGAGLLGVHTRCHLCVAEALKKQASARVRGERSDWGRGVVHDANNEEPGHGAVAEAQAVAQLRYWQPDGGEGYGE